MHQHAFAAGRQSRANTQPLNKAKKSPDTHSRSPKFTIDAETLRSDYEAAAASSRQSRSGPPPGAYQSAPSQPETSRKKAPLAASRSCSGERRTPRAVATSVLG